MAIPHNCRHCAFMICGDANWCDSHDEAMSDAQISVARKCPEWRRSRIDALTLEDWHEREPKGSQTVFDGQMSMEVS